MIKPRIKTDDRSGRYRHRVRRPLTLEHCEERALLAGPEIDAVNFMVSLSSKHSPIANQQTMLVRLEPVRNGFNDTLRFSAIPISNVPGYADFSGSLSAASDHALAMEAYVDAILSDGRFGAALDAEYSSAGRDAIILEVDRSNGEVDYFQYTDAAGTDMSGLEVIPTPVMPTIGNIQPIDPVPRSVERSDDNGPIESAPGTILLHQPKTKSRLAPLDPSNVTISRLSDDLPGEGEVIRLATTSALVAAELEWSDVRLRSDSDFIVTSIQRVAATQDGGEPQSDASLVDSAAPQDRVDPIVALEPTPMEAPLLAAVTSLEVALVFEWGGSPGDQELRAFGSVTPTFPPVQEVARAGPTLLQTASVARMPGPSDRTEDSESPFPVRKLAAAPAILIIAGALWTKVRSRSAHTAVPSKSRRKLNLMTRKQS